MQRAAMSPSFQTILAALQRHGVEFAVVGGVAAVLHGAPVTTFNLDTLVRVSDRNAQRLLAAFNEINARFAAMSLRSSRSRRTSWPVGTCC